MKNKLIVAFDFDGVIIDTAYESYTLAAKTFGEMTGQNVFSEHNAQQYIKGRAFSLNAETNYTLMKLIAENPSLDFSNFSQKKFDKHTEKNKNQGKVFAGKFIQNRHKLINTNEWLELQKPFINVQKAVEEISKTNNTYIVSTKAKPPIVALLKHYRIHFSEEKIFSENKGETKEELLKDLAKKENTTMSKILLIDDAIKQLAAVKREGAKTILAMWGEKRKVFEDEANRLKIKIAYSPKDCLKIIKELEEESEN